jgi:hypothetical protein
MSSRTNTHSAPEKEPISAGDGTSGRQDPPGAVSDQNGEEAERGHHENGEPPEPQTQATSGKTDNPSGAPGAAGEGSQSTGHPDNAG